ncbi:response regulator transcription factor [Embleya sp. NBC_00896]|uniref:response regulator transcription factor n=1 Tax=Embleya sp. NBC_00896 TaxID=2975961 RepID=UPI003866A749|nr:helix-turn-helix transcriptional regulator [Embleya sp. NBC_00896]
MAATRAGGAGGVGPSAGSLGIGRGAALGAAGAVEPLSERELTIVHYLRSDLTLREIAADLYISVNTMKTHTRHIYRKLGVTGRRDLITPRETSITPSPTPTHP